MTPLRTKMIRELELHRKSPKTVECYVTAVAQLARHYGRSPEKVTLEEIRDYLHHLITVKKVAYSTCNQKLAGIRFFYREVLAECRRLLGAHVPVQADKPPETAARWLMILLGIDIRQCPRCGGRLHSITFDAPDNSPTHVCRRPACRGFPPWDTS